MLTYVHSLCYNTQHVTIQRLQLFIWFYILCCFGNSFILNFKESNRQIFNLTEMRGNVVFWPSLLTFDPRARLHWPCLFERGMGTCRVSTNSSEDCVYIHLLVWDEIPSCNFPSAFLVIFKLRRYSMKHKPVPTSVQIPVGICCDNVL